MRRVLKHLGIFLLWNIGASVLLIFVPAPFGVLAALALSGWLLWGYVLRSGEGERRRWAVLRMRPLRGPALSWTLVAIPVMLALSWSAGEVWTRLVDVPMDNLDPFEQIFRTPLQRMSLAIFAISVAPLLEEFFFRGLIQYPLERRHGAGKGILLAAVFFAIIHMLPWVFPLYVLLGAAFGFVVYATRSIWAGVMLHAANNSAALLGQGAQAEELPPVPTLWETGFTPEWWVSVGMLGLSVLAAIYVGRRLWQAGRVRLG